MTKHGPNNRLELITHYVIARTPPDQLGATKLNKVLWICDTLAWREFGHSLTGMTNYRRLPRGPVQTRLKPALRTLVDEQKIFEKKVPTPVGERHEFTSLVDPDIKSLSGPEIDLIHRAIDFVRPHTASSISDLSHDAYWEELPENAEMSVAAGGVWPSEIDDETMDWAEREAKRIFAD